MNAPAKIVSVKTSPAECFTVRNGWAWAHIFIRHGVGRQHDGSPRYWVHVSVISDYGSFGYCWSHIGEEWHAFIRDLDLHYAMNKMMGERFRVPLTVDEAEAYGRATILQYRREDSLSRKDARLLWDGLSDAERDEGLTAFLRSWDDHSDGRWYAHDWWDHRWDKVNPQAEGFWREVWPHFIAALPEGVATTPTADGDGSNAEGGGQPNTESTPS